MLQSEKYSSYDEMDRIGRGAYGTVYKGKDRRTGKFVALKKVWIPIDDEGMPKSTLREIGLLRQLNAKEHPNIVQLLDVCHGQRLDTGLIIFLVFEHVDQDLGLFIERRKNHLPTKHIRNMIREILTGLDFLHSNRIVHRDLKPQNLLVTNDGHIKIADFGLAKTYSFDMKLTSIVVTLWYRAPEVLLSECYSSSVDIWSVACIMAELYALQPLFCGKAEFDQLNKIFRVLGLPSENDWPENVPLKWESFDIHGKLEIRNVVPRLCPAAIDLLEKMFIFLPAKRISTAKALQHAYFTDEPLDG